MQALQSVDTLKPGQAPKPCSVVEDEASYRAEYGAKQPVWRYTTDWTACPVTCEGPPSQTRVTISFLLVDEMYLHPD